MSVRTTLSHRLAADRQFESGNTSAHICLYPMRKHILLSQEQRWKHGRPFTNVVS